VIPMLQGRQDRHVVRLKHIETGREHIGQPPFVYEHGRLAFAHSELGAVFDLMALTLEPPDHRVAGVISPVDDVDELAGEKIENAHGCGPC